MQEAEDYSMFTAFDTRAADVLKDSNAIASESASQKFKIHVGIAHDLVKNMEAAGNLAEAFDTFSADGSDADAATRDMIREALRNCAAVLNIFCERRSKHLAYVESTRAFTRFMVVSRWTYAEKTVKW